MISFLEAHAWVGWLVVFAIASAIEVATLTYFAAWVACAALVVSAAAYWFPTSTPSFQLGLWILLSILFCFLWRHFFPPERKVESEADAIGEQAVVTHVGGSDATILFPKPIMGQVSWKARASGPLHYEDRVEVTAVEYQGEGNAVLRVKRVAGERHGKARPASE